MVEYQSLTLYCLAAISMLKQEVESLTELDKSAELLVRLLCAVPGWSEKNVQVIINNCVKGNAYFFCRQCDIYIMIETGSTASY